MTKKKEGFVDRLKKFNLLYSHSDKVALMAHLKDKGQKKPKSWKLIDSEACGENELNFDVKPLLVSLSKKHGFSKNYNFITTVSNPDAESRLDFGQFRVRYRYGIANDHRGESLIKENTRDFCATLVRQNNLYRREDINIMSFRGANPIAKQNYSIFKLKGHWNCRHAWIREVYVVERDPAETENNPIVEKTTLMSKKIEDALKAFKEATKGEELTQAQIVELNKQLLSEQKFVDVKVDDKILRIDGEIAEGTEVSWIDDAGEVSEVPDGEITLTDEKKVLEVTGGKISKVTDVEEETEEGEGATEQLSKEEVEKVVEEKLSAIVDEKLEKFSADLDEKLSSIPAFSKTKVNGTFKKKEDKEDKEEKPKTRRRNPNAEFSTDYKEKEDK